MVNTISDKKTLMNIAVGSSAVQLNDIELPFDLNIQDVVQFETKRDDGEQAVCTSFVATDGKIYQTLSPTIDDAINTFLQFHDLKVDGNLEVTIFREKNHRTKREYLTMKAK